jgi:hypothetical protein
MQLALDALESALSDDQPYITKCVESVATLKAELAKPEPEPAGYFAVGGTGGSVKTRFVQFSDSCAGNPGVIPLYRKEEKC